MSRNLLKSTMLLVNIGLKYIWRGSEIMAVLYKQNLKMMDTKCFKISKQSIIRLSWYTRANDIKFEFIVFVS